MLARRPMESTFQICLAEDFYFAESLFADGLLLGAAGLLFGLESVVEFRAGLIALEDVQFIRSAPDSLFKRQRLDRRFLRACASWHGGITSADYAIPRLC